VGCRGCAGPVPVAAAAAAVELKSLLHMEGLVVGCTVDNSFVLRVLGLKGVGGKLVDALVMLKVETTARDR